MIHDADQAANRLIDFVEHGRMAVVGGDPIELAAHSICVHGDTPGAVEMARLIRSQLVDAGLDPRPFLAT